MNSLQVRPEYLIYTPKWETARVPDPFIWESPTGKLDVWVQNRTAPSNIEGLFQDISNLHSYNTRSTASKNFYTTPSKLSVQANSFPRTEVKVWKDYLKH